MSGSGKYLPAAVFLAVAGALFALYVWPTPYSIAPRTAVGPGEEGFMRVNRITGVTEVSTDHGWRTEEQVHDEHEARRAIEQSAVQNDLSSLRIDDDGQSFRTLTVNNASDWNLGSDAPANTTVEYFTYRNDGTKSFIAKQECGNPWILSDSHSFMDTCSELGIPQPIHALPAYEPIAQHVTMTFDLARNTKTSRPGDLPVVLVPPVVLHADRYWYSEKPLTPERRAELQSRYDALKSSGAIDADPALSLWMRGMRYRSLVQDNSARTPAGSAEAAEPHFAPPPTASAVQEHVSAPMEPSVARVHSSANPTARPTPHAAEPAARPASPAPRPSTDRLNLPTGDFPPSGAGSARPGGSQ